MTQLTDDEKTLFLRVSLHMETGISIDDAIERVRFDQDRIARDFGVFHPYLVERSQDKKQLFSALSYAIWTELRKRAGAPT